jgi:peptidoglycan hydrolase CwlO-like protein
VTTKERKTMQISSCQRRRHGLPRNWQSRDGRFPWLIVISVAIVLIATGLSYRSYAQQPPQQQMTPSEYALSIAGELSDAGKGVASLAQAMESIQKQNGALTAQVQSLQKQLADLQKKSPTSPLPSPGLKK